jgi:late competence protein required for DNA uptake (superfamily II DNA/RNA helicase)
LKGKDTPQSVRIVALADVEEKAQGEAVLVLAVCVHGQTIKIYEGIESDDYTSAR